MFPHAKTVALTIFLTAFSMVLTVVHAGHEVPFYPSYYPQEIRIEVVEPARAARLLQDAAIHAYVGKDPFAEGKVPANVDYVESLGSYLVLTFNPASSVLTDKEARCATARTLLHALAGVKEAFIFHPYPVTPYHMDYLHHFDLAASAKQRSLDEPTRGQAPPSPTLNLKANGKLARKLVEPRWQLGETTWDVTLEEINVRDLIASHTVNVNGWLGPPWVKEGWFHAYLILADTLSDDTAKHTVKSISRRLQQGDYRRGEEKLNLERRLVRLLTRGCNRAVVGYTVKREYFNSDYSAGIENIAFDSHTGFNSPIFIRTVKLKDFPWNGWLRLGIDAKPSAAWNPIAGFTDPAGQLIWFAVGDPALLPHPYSASWVLNRIADFRPTRTDRRHQGATTP
ncbi:MAG: hypothetical protein ACE5G5_00580 [Candidatus Methylomirabilales bacterium]